MEPFSLQYAHEPSGRRVTERPRLLVSADGSERRLVIGDPGEEVTLALGPRALSEGELWAMAHEWVTSR